jgi:shikimate dehydrogenase
MKFSVNNKAKFGLVGYPLEHSFSPTYYHRRFRELGLNHHSYYLLPIENPLNLAMLGSYGFCGYNVTIPHKKNIIPYLDYLDPIAKQINAVNCIKVKEGVMSGYNTDFYGFKISLQRLLKNEKPENALILGDGASSDTVAYVLSDMDITFLKISRKNAPFYNDVSRRMVQKSSLIINTTPVGMHPNINEAPLFPYEYLTEKHFLFDLVYNPSESLFLSRGRKLGCQCVNGLEMLHLQAEKSLKIWGLLSDSDHIAL